MSATICLGSWDKKKKGGMWPEGPWLLPSPATGELDLVLVASECQVWVRTEIPKGRPGPKSLWSKGHKHIDWCPPDPDSWLRVQLVPLCYPLSHFVLRYLGVWLLLPSPQEMLL